MTMMFLRGCSYFVIVDGGLIPKDYRHKMSHNDDNDDYDKTVSLT